MGSFYKVGIPSGGNLSRAIGGKTDSIGLKVLCSEVLGSKFLGFGLTKLFFGKPQFTGISRLSRK
jgi:hypothetical protein